jgi:CRP/FNR family transcriptional regulator, cyclic AMP receptor protein
MASPDDLAGIPLFGALSRDEVAQLAPRFEAKTVSEGVRLASEGASGYSFFVLAEGSAIVSVGDEIVATYGPGDFFGEMAILGDGRRSATVTTTSPSKVLSLFGTEFRRLQQTQPAVAVRLEQAMQQRRQELLELPSSSNDPS